MTWLATKEEAETFKENENNANADSSRPAWVPKLEFQNAIDVKQHDEVRGRGVRMRVGYAFTYKMKDVVSKKARKEDQETAWDIKNEDLGFDPRFAYWFRVQYECSLVCAENLELEFFPFDVCVCVSVYLLWFIHCHCILYGCAYKQCQDLGIHMQCMRTCDKMELLPFPRY